MDELEAVQRLLAERPPPAPDVVTAARASLEQAVAGPAHGLAPLHLNGGRYVLDQAPVPPNRWRRWRGWLAPAAAATAVAIVIAVSLAVSNTVGFRQAGMPPPATPAAFAKVPRYFVTLTGKALPYQGEHAEVVATATGAVLGSVTVPKPYTVFTEAAAAGDDRTFVLAAQRGKAVTYVGGRHGPLMYYGVGPAKFYKLVIARSGRPSALTALPVSPVTGDVNGFALSPDGSKLAVSVLPPIRLRPGRPAPPPRGSRLMVFTLATGAGRDWTLPGIGWIGMNKPNAQSLSWAGDNRTLLFQDQLGTGGATPQIRLLDTATPGGSVLAASRPVPFSAKQLSSIGGVLILSADGTKIFTAATTTVTHGGITAQQRRSLRPPRQCPWRGRAAHYSAHCQKIFKELGKRATRVFNQERRDGGGSLVTYTTYRAFSVRTGKPAGVLGRLHGPGDTRGDVNWANATGDALIADGPGPGSTIASPRLAFGVVTGGSFTPFPSQVQALLSMGRGTW